MTARSSSATIPGSAALALLVVLSACTSADARPAALQQSETFTLSADRVAIYNLAGTARVESHSGSDVLVEVLRGGDEGDRLTVAVDEIGDREALRVIYPDGRISYPESPSRGRTRVRVRGDGTFGDDDVGSILGGLFRSTDRVTISDSGGGTEAWADLRILVPEDGRDVAVYVALGEIGAEGVVGPLRLDLVRGAASATGTRGRLVIDTGSGSAEATNVAGDVELDTGSGSIRVSGVEGNADLDTGSGSVDVRNVTGGRVAVDTGSGSVRGASISAREVDVDTGSGRVAVEAVSAAVVRVDTGSGSVSLDLASDVDDLEIDTGSGSVELAVPEGLGADIDVDTGSGGISTDVPVQIRSSRRGNLEGVIGDGVGRIEIDTGSGGVRIVPR